MPLCNPVLNDRDYFLEYTFNMPPLMFNLFEYIIVNYHTINALLLNVTGLNLYDISDL